MASHPNHLNHHTTDQVTTQVINPPAGGTEISLSRPDSLIEKDKAYHLESEYGTKPDPNTHGNGVIENEGDVDQFGGALHIPPEEIALRKKLDRRIIVILWAMYFLNYSESARLAAG